MEDRSLLVAAPDGATASVDDAHEIPLEILDDDEPPAIAVVLPSSAPAAIGPTGTLAGPRTQSKASPPPLPDEDREWRKRRELANMREALRRRMEAGETRRGTLAPRTASGTILPGMAPAPTPTQTLVPAGAPAAAAAQPGSGPTGDEDDRGKRLEAECEELKRQIGELAKTREAQAAAHEREVVNLRRGLLQKDQEIATLRKRDAGASELGERLRQAEADRDRLAGELAELPPPDAAQAAQHERRLAELEQMLEDREQQAADRVGRLEEDRDRLARELDEARRAPPTPGASFLREHDILELRQVVNRKERQILDLTAEVDGRERKILDHKLAALEIQRRAADLEERILEREQKLLDANERLLGRDEQIARLEQSVAESQAGRASDRAEAEQVLLEAQAAAAAERERLSAEHRNEREQATSDHAAALELLRESHDDELAGERQAGAARLAELSARSDEALTAARQRAEEELAAQGAARRAELAAAEARQQAELERRADMHRGDVVRLEREHEMALVSLRDHLEARQAAAAEQHRQAIEASEARHADEAAAAAAAAEARLAALVAEQELRLAEQEQAFGDLKLGMRQRHAAEMAELVRKHADEVGRLTADVGRRDESIAALEGRIAEQTAALAVLDQRMAQAQDALQRSSQRLRNDRRLAEQARKVLSMAVSLLDEHVAQPGDEAPGGKAEEPQP